MCADEAHTVFLGISHLVPFGVYLKPALVQVAHAAVKSDKSPYYKQKYERIRIHMCADEAHTVFLGISHLVPFDGFNDTVRLLL